jgi:hypothetical protein
MAKKRRKGISAYFRKVFTDKPEWLESTRNDVVVAQYRTDHGLAEGKPVHKAVKSTMANVKSTMRKEKREADTNGLQIKAKATGSSWSPPPAPAMVTLESLEELIDECLVAAKSYDRTGLNHVIRHLRTARNQVVWKMGQKDQ